MNRRIITALGITWGAVAALSSVSLAQGAESLPAILTPVSIGQAVHGPPAPSETPAETECKDAASEGDEEGMAAAFRRCELLYGLTAARAMADCAEEDGSGASQALPCRWDANERGNGKGYSFVVSKVSGKLFYTYYDFDADEKLGGF